MLQARLLPLEPQPLALAQALSGRPEAFLLWDATRASASYLGCDPVEVRHGLDPEPGAAGTYRGDLGRAPRWVGLLPYESVRAGEARTGTRLADVRPEPHLSRPSWWRFGAVAEVTDRVRVIGDDPACVDHLCQVLGRAGNVRPTSARLALAEPLEAAELHRARIAAALELIRAGNIYQVNLARRFVLSVSGHPFAVLASLGSRARFPYCAAFRLGDLDVVSSSPELFLKTDGGRVYTAPIKGTRPRGTHAERDRALIRELAESEKEAAELTMILDVERNDLGRVAEVGTVRLLQRPSVATYPTLHHRAALLGAIARKDVGLEALLQAMLPSGSVTGAPKLRAMQVIAELEAHRRGLYTGAFGMLSHSRELTLAMAIRTLTVREGEGHYFSGGGIVADSLPGPEIDETAWKALQLLPLVERAAGS